LNDVEIAGVPETQDEDLGDILQKLFAHAGCSTTISTVKNVFRKKKSKNGLPGTIVATFGNIANKTEFITTTRKKNLSSSILGSETPRPIYINESLTKHNKYLFYLARDLRRKKLVKYAWTDHGHIMVKTDDNTDSVVINNATTIERIRDQIHLSN
jgi:Baculovirus FP protein